jgi:short-subunit dehydrogenase
MTEGHHERWALVTGASAGIGKAFADLLAENGFNLVLTARRDERLHKHARELEERWGGKTLVLVEDLTEPAAAQRIYDATQAEAIEIDLLVNNAGYGLPGQYTEVDWPTHLASLQVMTTSVCHLTHLYLLSMQRRDYGRIINVASVAAHVPGSSGHTLYAAKKAFLVKFSESLWSENLGTNVYCTALSPGFTYSEFHDITGSRKQVAELPEYMWMDAKTVAEKGYQAVMKNKVICIPGNWNKFVVALAKYLPNWIGYAVARRMTAKVRQQEI